MNSQEIKAGESKGCLEIEDLQTVALHQPKTSFTFKHQSRNPVTAENIQRFRFSRVFGPETNQGKFFEETSLDVVKEFINGVITEYQTILTIMCESCLVFSYGITSTSGKVLLYNYIKPF